MRSIYLANLWSSLVVEATHFWKTWVKLEIFPKFRGENEKNIGNHLVFRFWEKAYLWGLCKF